jgi:hypothetical protein
MTRGCGGDHNTIPPAEGRANGSSAKTLHWRRQIMEVSAVNGNTITFSIPFHITFKTEHRTQLSLYANPVLHRAGIEDLYVYGGMGGHGNISVFPCAYCWVKNIELHWSIGTSVSFSGTAKRLVYP